MEAYLFEFSAMASPCRLMICSANALAAEVAARATVDEVRRIESRYSRYLPESELSRLNDVAREGGVTIVDDEMAALLDFAFSAYEKSEGVFDITSGVLRRAWNYDAAKLPSRKIISELLNYVGLQHLLWERPLLHFLRAGMEIDFGGIGKEFAVDRAAEVIRISGCPGALINFGGDVFAMGVAPTGESWEVSIADPRDAGRNIMTVSLRDQALATSGDYERYIEVDGRRYCHILNPRTGMAVEGMSSATVISTNCMAAGVFSSVAMIKGRSGAEWLESQGLPYLCVTQEGQVLGNLQAD